MGFLRAPARAVIFDLGDVLFTWSATTTTTISARMLKEVLSTPTWHSYERGEITRDACYELSAEKFSVTASEIAEAFSQAQESLQRHHAVIQLIHELKHDPPIQLYAMSNIGKEDFADLESKMDWSLFDQVFTSAMAGTRKPETYFFRHVLDQISLSGSQVVFIDDKEENVQAARALGIRGFVFEESTLQDLREIFGSPVGMGWRYLFQYASYCDSVTSTGVSFPDNFAKLLILDVLGDRTLIDLSWGSRITWNFFADEAALGPGVPFPDDLDTTALALRALGPSSGQTISSVLDLMARYSNSDGTFQTYFDRGRARVDPVVSANVLACFYSYNRGHEFERTLQLIRSTLLDRSYISGTRYYPSPDCCLGFIGRLLRSSSDDNLHDMLGPLLKARLRERLGLGGSAMDLAMRILACATVRLPCEEDRRTLLKRQCEDGSWEAGWMYQYGSTGVKIGNCAATTAVAVAALSSPSTRTVVQTSGEIKPYIEKS